jgi:hypothetical protein
MTEEQEVAGITTSCGLTEPNGKTKKEFYMLL